MSARGGAAVARWAHNPKVGRSNRPPATDGAAGRLRFVISESYWHALRVLEFEDDARQGSRATSRLCSRLDSSQSGYSPRRVATVAGTSSERTQRSFARLL